MCSACAASQMSQYILASMLLCVGAISSPSPSCWGLKGRGRPYSTETLPGKAMWKKMNAITVGLSCLSGPYMWMGSVARWAAEAGAESSAPVWQCPLSTVLSGPASHVVCLPQCPCKPVLQRPGAHVMGHSRAQLSGGTPWSGAPNWPHRGTHQHYRWT